MPKQSTRLANALSESTSLTTLMVMSVLSYHQSAVNCPAGQEVAKVNELLHSATAVLAVTFAITSSLPPSSLDKVLDLGKYNFSSTSTVVSIQGASDYLVPEIKDTCDSSVDTTACESISDDNSCDSLVDMSGSEDISDEEEIDNEEDDQFSQTFSVVESDEVKSSWTSRVRMSKMKKPRSIVLQQLQAQYISPMKSCDSLHSIPEYAGLPAMTPCDSLLSMSSGFSSFNTRCSSSNLLSVAHKTMTRNMNSSARKNAEWAIIE